jgi:hypothetical protein
MVLQHFFFWNQPVLTDSDGESITVSLSSALMRRNAGGWLADIPSFSKVNDRYLRKDLIFLDVQDGLMVYDMATQESKQIDDGMCLICVALEEGYPLESLVQWFVNHFNITKTKALNACQDALTFFTEKNQN